MSTPVAAPSPASTPADLVPSPPQLASRLRLAVARLSRRISREATSAGDDLTASRLAALVTIEHFGPITLGELAAVEQVQPPSMTRIVARLEELGLAARETDPADRRVMRLRTTERGRTLLERSRTRRDAFLAQRVARFTDDERALLARALPLLERLQDDAG